MSVLEIPVGAFAFGNIVGNPPNSGVQVTGLPISDFVESQGGDPNAARILLDIADGDIDNGDVDSDGNSEAYIVNGTRPQSMTLDIDGDGIADYIIRGQNPNDLDILSGGQEGTNIARFNGSFRFFDAQTNALVYTMSAQNLYMSSNGNFPEPGEVKQIEDSGTGDFIIEDADEPRFPAPPAVCFVAGTMIETDSGEKPVEELQIGDLVRTRDNGFQPVRWVGARTVHKHQQQRDGRYRPVRIAAGILGNDRPLRLSQQHRVLVRGARVELMFGLPEALVPAVALLDDRDVVLEPPKTVTYVHVLLDRHELLHSNGCFSESILPGEVFLNTQAARTRDELRAMFPELFGRGTLSVGPQAITPVLKAFEGAVLH